MTSIYIKNKMSPRQCAASAYYVNSEREIMKPEISSKVQESERVGYHSLGVQKTKGGTLGKSKGGPLENRFSKGSPLLVFLSLIFRTVIFLGRLYFFRTSKL